MCRRPDVPVPSSPTTRVEVSSCIGCVGMETKMRPPCFIGPLSNERVACPCRHANSPGSVLASSSAVYQLATQLPPCPRASRSLTTGQSYKGIRVSDRVTNLAHVSSAGAAVGAAVLAGLRDGQPLQRLAAQLVEEIVLLVLGLGRRRRLRVRLAVLMVEGSGPSSGEFRDLQRFVSVWQWRRSRPPAPSWCTCET